LKYFKKYLEFLLEGNKGKTRMNDPSSKSSSSFSNKNTEQKELNNVLSRTYEVINNTFEKILNDEKESQLLFFFLQNIFPDNINPTISSLEDLFKINDKIKSILQKLENNDDPKIIKGLKTINFLKLIKDYSLKIIITTDEGKEEKITYNLKDKIIEKTTDKMVVEKIVNNLKRK
jgi:hypothetical protein